MVEIYATIKVAEYVLWLLLVVISAAVIWVRKR